MDARKFGRLNFSPRTWRLFPNFVTPLQLRSNSKFSKLSPFLLSNNPLETRSSHPLCCNSTSLNFQFYFLRIREQALDSFDRVEGREKRVEWKSYRRVGNISKIRACCNESFFSLRYSRRSLSLSLRSFFFFPSSLFPFRSLMGTFCALTLVPGPSRTIELCIKGH